MAKDYIPERELDFVAWVDNLIKVCKSSQKGWELYPQNLVKLEKLFREFKPLHETCLDNSKKTPALTSEKNEKKKSMKAEARKFIRSNLRDNEKIKSNGWLRLAIPEPVRKRTYRKRVNLLNAPGISTKPLSHHGLELIINPASTRPDDRHLIRYGIGETAPVTADELPWVKVIKPRKYTMMFKKHEAGLRTHFAVCHVDINGEQSPWSSITTAVIP
jgi:hypothetical protein